MSVLRNQIYIGSLETPLFYFENDQIEAPNGIESVDIIGEKLPIDSFSPIVHYKGEDIDSLRLLPFGTPVWHYNNNALVRKFYIRSVERQSKTAFKLDTISAIGILDKQYHKGGLYRGTRFDDLMAELIGDTIVYEIDEDVAATKIFGWLPFETKRNNLHQVMFATNASIVKNDDGNMKFVFLRDDGNPTVIDDDRIYLSGSVTYPTVATEVQLTEHSYQYVDTLEPVSLVDNTSGEAQTNALYIFDNAPIVVETLVTEGNLQIVDADVNYAIVSGSGTLTGIPYFDRTSIVTRKRASMGEEYAVSVDDATLVTVVNSENIADRLMDYYSSEKTVKGDVKLSGERTGKRYIFNDAFGEQVVAYLGKMTTYASSFIKAACEFIAGYISNKFGNNYTDYIEVTEPCNLVVPEGCKLLKLIIIGGGDGASSGLKGENVEIPDDESEVATPQKGGEAGVPGESGKIREVTIVNPESGNYSCLIGMHGVGGAICFSSETRNNGTAGTDSSVTTPSGTVYSSSDSSSYRSEYGIPNIFTGKSFGKKGRDGIKGGDGGSGSSGNSDDGEDVIYKGKTYKGGKGTQSKVIKFTHVEQSAQYGSAGGEGAMAYGDGGDADQATNIQHTDETTQRGATAWEEIYAKLSFPGYSDITVPEEYTERGCGGDAGNGGAGRGGNSLNDWIYQDYKDSSNKSVHLIAGGGGMGQNPAGGSKRGTAGRDGGRGIIIAYSDVPLSIENINNIPMPRLEPAGNVSDTNIKLLASNLLVGETYIFERNIMVDGTIEGVGLYEESKMYYHAYQKLKTFVATSESMVITNNAGEGFFLLNDATYKYRIRGVGSESLGESEYSNECIAGIGRPQLQKKNMARIDLSFRDGMYMSYIYKPEYSGTTAYYERRLAKGPQWINIGAIRSNNTLITDDTTKQGEFNIYRAYFAQDGYIFSPYSDELGIQIPSIITNKLCAPAIYTVTFQDDYSIYDEAIIIYANPLDERSQKVNIMEKLNGGEWSSLGVASIGSGRSPLNFPLVHSSGFPAGYVETFKLKNIGEGNYEDSEYSNEVTITIPNKVATPSAEASASSSSVSISWNAVENATGYRVRKKKSTETDYSIVADNLHTLSYTDGSVEAGVTYEYYVIALGNQTTYYNSSRSEIMEVTV